MNTSVMPYESWFELSEDLRSLHSTISDYKSRYARELNDAQEAILEDMIFEIAGYARLVSAIASENLLQRTQTQQKIIADQIKEIDNFLGSVEEFRNFLQTTTTILRALTNIATLITPIG